MVERLEAVAEELVPEPTEAEVEELEVDLIVLEVAQVGVEKLGVDLNVLEIEYLVNVGFPGELEEVPGCQ